MYFILHFCDFELSFFLVHMLTLLLHPASSSEDNSDSFAVTSEVTVVHTSCDASWHTSSYALIAVFIICLAPWFISPSLTLVPVHHPLYPLAPPQKNHFWWNSFGSENLLEVLWVVQASNCPCHLYINCSYCCWALTTASHWGEKEQHERSRSVLSY